MPRIEGADELDNWRFERLYNNLFCRLVERGSNEDKWRYDPLDSKYPTIDGILRRERKGAKFHHLPEFALVQLKGTRFVEGEDPWPKLKAEFSKKRTGKRSPIEQVDAIKESCSALLIGLSVDIVSEEIKAAYIGAPTDYPTDRKPENRIERGELLKEVVAVLDALRPPDQRVLPLANVTLERPATITRQVIFPRQKEIIYFDKQPDGMVSVGQSGVISGRNISINWTIPRGISTVSISIVSGSPKIVAVPVRLPGPPYNEYVGLEEKLADGKWQVKGELSGINSDELWWVLQIRFEKCEAVIKAEAWRD